MPSIDAYDVVVPAHCLRIRPRRIDLAPFDPASSSSTTPSSTLAYLGIPYARPPVGPLRWRPPQRPLCPSSNHAEPTLLESRWARDACQNIRDQLSITVGREAHKTSIGQGEDCLTLNIWVPEAIKKAHKADQGKLFPVGVWIHGGGFSTGSASMPLHDGARLAKEQNIIIVSIQYRLGVMGFFGSAQLAEEDPGPDPYFAECFTEQGRAWGNYGIWDAAAALQWLQENVHRFGGDRAAITAFGESAGSILIHYLMLSPSVPGNLFSRAILQSGTATALPARSRASAQAVFDFLIAELRPEFKSATADDQIAALRSVTYDALFKALAKLGPGRRPRSEYWPGPGRPPIRTEDAHVEAVNRWAPIWDGVMVPSDYRELLEKGFSSTNGNGRDGVILGWTVDEGSIFSFMVSSVPALKEQFSTFHPAHQTELSRTYRLDRCFTDANALAIASAVTGDAMLLGGILRTTQRLSENASAPPTRAYSFGLRPSLKFLEASTPCAELFEELFGCLHTAEIPFVFGFDATEPHTRQSRAYGVPIDAAFAPPPRTRSSMTREEIELSTFVMQAWGAFIRGEDDKLWAEVRTGKSSELEDIPVMALGDTAPIGDPRGCVSSEAHLTQIDRLALWDSKIVPGGPSLKERYDIWGRLETWSLEYYGNPSYREPLQ